MLPIYKVKSLTKHLVTSIATLEDLPFAELVVLQVGTMSYVSYDGFVRFVIQVNA